MIVFLLRRLMQSVFVLLAMSMIVFVAVYAIGDPVKLLINPESAPAQIEETKRALGLDRPLGEQYLLFLKSAIKGELGDSYIYNTPALKLIIQRLPATLELAAVAIFIAVVAGIPLGLLAGTKRNSVVGRSIMAGSILGFSLPSFWVGLMMVLIFSIKLGWLPTFGRGQTVEFLGLPISVLTLDGLQHIILPAVNLSLFPLALIIRLTRSGLTETLLQEFIKFARAKGLRDRRIMGVHVLKNILIPILTVAGIQFGSLLAFAVVTESVFAWPGMGKLIIDSLNLLDRPVIVAYLMVTVMLFIFINLIVDLLSAALDPRIRLNAVKE